MYLDVLIYVYKMLELYIYQNKGDGPSHLYTGEHSVISIIEQRLSREFIAIRTLIF